MIVQAAEDEREARAHHRVIHNRLSQYQDTGLPEFDAMVRDNVLRELEDRIAVEIKAYVEIEAELRRSTDVVQIAGQTLETRE